MQQRDVAADVAGREDRLVATLGGFRVPRRPATVVQFQPARRKVQDLEVGSPASGDQHLFEFRFVFAAVRLRPVEPDAMIGDYGGRDIGITYKEIRRESRNQTAFLAKREVSRGVASRRVTRVLGGSECFRGYCFVLRHPVGPSSPKKTFGQKHCSEG